MESPDARNEVEELLRRAVGLRGEARWSEVIETTGPLVERLGRPDACECERWSRDVLADALGVRIEALSATGQEEEALALTDQLFELTRDARQEPLLDAAVFSRRTKIVLLLRGSRAEEAVVAGREMDTFYRQAVFSSSGGCSQSSSHVVEAAYVLMTRDQEELAIELLEGVAERLTAIEDDAANAPLARAHATALVAAVRAGRADLAERECFALATLGESAVDEIESLSHRVEKQGRLRPELAQLMIAKIRCLGDIDDAKAELAAREFVSRFADARDPALRDSVSAMMGVLGEDPRA